MVITVHGAGSNRSRTMDEAAILGRHGYGLLMIDVEGFGESDGESNGFGWVGARDVHAAVDYLKTAPKSTRGAAAASVCPWVARSCSMPPANPRISRRSWQKAPPGRTGQDFSEGPMTKFALPFHWVIGQCLQVLTGQPSPPPLKQLVQQIAPRDVLLISSSIDEESQLMGMYADIGGPSFQLWTIPEPKHVGAFDLHPEEYEERVVRFFDESLLGDTAPGAPELAAR